MIWDWILASPERVALGITVLAYWWQEIFMLIVILGIPIGVAIWIIR